MSAPEGIWRLLHFDLHAQSPNIVRLQIHLLGQHLVRFDPAEAPETVLQRAAGERTMLTAFFQMNADPGDPGKKARSITYQEFPQFFVWKDNKWRERKKGFALGRMYFVSPNAGERFYLRTLLTVVKGPTSFAHLRTFNGVCYDSFKATCLARGLLEDDGEWRQCLQEAVKMQTGARCSVATPFCHAVMLL